MISSFRNFAKTKFAGLLVFIMIIPFVFWGMGSMFSSGNSNTIAKINETNISTQEFIDYLNNSQIPQETIQKNLNNNIIEELLSGLISRTLLELEIKDYKIIISEKSLSKKIKKNKNFIDEKGNFQRMKYEKFLLENNQSAPSFELRLKGRELQKNLFDYIGAGTVSPKFLINKLYQEENKKAEINYVNLKNFYKKKAEISDNDLKEFINNNKDQLKVEYIDFNYVLINPKNLIGVEEFNQAFFDKIDQIEIDISNDIEFETIISALNIKPVEIKNFKFSEKKNEIEKRIFNLRKNNFDIFEIGNDFVLYQVKSINEREPNLNDEETKNEILELFSQENKFDYNRKLLQQIKNKEFNENDFKMMSKEKMESIKIDSIKDNQKFDVNAVEVLYSLPEGSFTLINDNENNIYLAQIKRFENLVFTNKNNELKEYINKHNSNTKNSLLKSYDLFLNDKYKVILNQKSIERVKNFFQ